LSEREKRKGKRGKGRVKGKEVVVLSSDERAHAAM
jgi:hypothetical protein